MSSAHVHGDGRFAGCFTAITTPFTADGSAIDYKRLDEQIAFQADGGVTGIVVSGTTGESPTLEEHEYHELVSRAVESGKRRGLMVIAGAGSNSTAHAVAMQQFAAKAGADATLSVNPYYNKPTQEGLYRHFMAAADASPLAVMLYNIPGRSGVALSFETIQRLVKHPNIRAIKDATGGLEMASEVAAQIPGLRVLSGDDPLTLAMLSLGAVGVVSVVSNLAPGRVQGLCRAFAEGRREEALKIHRELSGLTRALFAETNPIPLKAAMALCGRDTGSLRLPMCGAGEATIARLKVELKRLELCR
jgi:4-hydroxy-tetrahydrodipicolinate synthase